MTSSNYPFSDEIAEMHLTKNIFGLFNVIHLSKFKMVNPIWNAFIDKHFFKFDDALKEKMLKVKRYLPLQQPYFSHFNLFYNKSAGFILDILTSTIGLHRDGVKNELIANLQQELPFLQSCNKALDWHSGRLYFWSPDGITFYQMQQENLTVRKAGRLTVAFRTDEDKPNPDSCCKIQFSPKKSSSSKKSFANAVLLDSSSQPILEFERCPVRQLELLLYFIMQNKIRMIPLQHRKDPACLIPFGSYNNLLLITRQKNNGRLFLHIRENDVWRDLPYTSDGFTVNFTQIIDLTFENNECKKIILFLNRDRVVTECDMVLNDGTKKTITPIDPIISDEILTGLDFLYRGVNPRPTPLDVIARPQSELQKKLA